MNNLSAFVGKFTTKFPHSNVYGMKYKLLFYLDCVKMKLHKRIILKKEKEFPELQQGSKTKNAVQQGTLRFCRFKITWHEVCISIIMRMILL